MKASDPRNASQFPLGPEWERLAQEGIFKRSISVRNGGQGDSLQSFAASLKMHYYRYPEIGFWLSVIAHQIGACVLDQFGSEAQVTRHLNGILDGSKLIAVCNSESSSGGNLRLIKSSAIKVDDSIYISSQKNCSTNLGAADLALVSVKISGSEGLKVVLVDDIKGRQVDLRNSIDGFQSGMTGSLTLQNHPAASGDFLSDPKSALQLIFNLERFFIASLMTEVMREHLMIAVPHAHSRIIDSKPILEHQYIEDKLVSIFEELSVVEGLLKDIELGSGYVHNDRLSLAKFISVEKALASAQTCIEVLGHLGVMKNSKLQSQSLDLTILKFLGGTKEFHKSIIADSLARKFAIRKDA